MLLMLLIQEIFVVIVERMDILLKIGGKRMVIQTIYHRIWEKGVKLLMVMVEVHHMLTDAGRYAIIAESQTTLRYNASRNMDIH